MGGVEARVRIPGIAPLVPRDESSPWGWLSTPGRAARLETCPQGGAKGVGKMNPEQKCDNCGEELGPNPMRRGEKVYCCEACVFEAQRSVDCGGRSDSTIAPSVVEQLDK